MTPDTLAQVHAAAFETARSWSAAEFASLLSQTGAILCGDERAFVLLRVTLDEAELLTLATHPTYRRQGLARIVLAHAEGAAESAGAATMFLEVAEDNRAARALYETAGYTQVGRRPGYYATQNAVPVAALVLRKVLGTD